MEEEEQEQEEQQQQPGSSKEGGAGDTEGRQAPTPQPRPISRKRQQERHDSEGAAPTAFHDGLATAAKRRSDSHRLPAAGSGGSRAEREAAQRRIPTVAPVGSRGDVPRPAAKQRQRRKQAQPQHLLPKQPEQEPSAVLNVSVEGAEEAAGSEGPAAASLHGNLLVNPAAADEATQAAQLNMFELLQASVQQAAAAASGLTPELAAAFVALLPLPQDKVRDALRCGWLHQRWSISAGLSNVRTSMHVAQMQLVSKHEYPRFVVLYCPCRRPTFCSCCSATSTARRRP